MRTIASLVALGVIASLSAAAMAQGKGYNAPPAGKYSEAEVAAALGLQPSEAGISWEDGAQQCIASKVLMGRKQIKVYADAGDTVATNASGTVGVKVGTYQGVDKRMCFDRFQAALEKLD